MTATTLKITEGQPAAFAQIEESYDPSYDYVGNGEEVPEIEKLVTLAWQRIESYISWRWGERTCVFVVEGDGDWLPPLQPATITTVEHWESNAWVTATLSPSPLGGYCLEGGHYRFTGTVGVDPPDPPRQVLESAFRLLQFFKTVDMQPEEIRYARTFETNRISEFGGPFGDMAGDVEAKLEYVPALIAKGMTYSGAADLLRPWRGLGRN